MSLAEQPGFWELRAKELEATTQKLQARIRHLEAENEALRQLPRSPHPPERHGEAIISLKNPPSQPQSRPTFKVNSLLALAPKTEDDWLERRKHLYLSDERSVIQTFFQFLSCTEFPATSSAQISDKSSTTEALLRRYQTFTQSLRQESDQARQIADFGTLLHISLCRVTRMTNKVPAATVDECMNNFLPLTKRKKGKAYLKKLRTSVLWPVGQAQALRPWLGNRADEFFLLCKTLVNAPPIFAR